MIKRVPLLLSALIIVLTSLNFSIPALAQQPQGRDVIEEIQIVGNRRIPREAILYYIQSKPRDRYLPAQVARDFEAVLAMGFFDAPKSKHLEHTGPKCGKIIICQLSESQVI